MKAGRNDPCTCGSGKKHKKCCGMVIPIVALTSPASISRQRQCGECTACCDGWLIGTIYGHEMRPGVPCYFVRQGGCSIYEERPQSPCRNFVCGWAAADSPFPDSFKPDQTGVIIMQIQWRNQPAYRLACAGNDPDPALLAWMMNFSQQTGRPFFYDIKGETLGYGSSAFQAEMQARIQSGEPLW